MLKPLKDIDKTVNTGAELQNVLIAAILAGVPAAIMVVDFSNRIAHWNQKMCDMFHVQPALLRSGDGNLVAKAMGIIIENSAEFLATINNVNTILQSKKILLHLKSGNIYEMQGQPYYITGIATGFVWVFHDITGQMYNQRLLAEKSSLVLEQNTLLDAAYRRLEDQAAELEMQNADMIQAQNELRDRLQSEWLDISNKLGQREQQILAMIGEHKDNKEIAIRLFISPRTVDTHRTNIRRKLGSTSTSEFMQAAYVAKKCFFDK